MTRLFSGTQWDRPATCDRCEKLESECKCPPPPKSSKQLDPARQIARVLREKRQKGKIVTLVKGLSEDNNDLGALLTQLKNRLGTGGSLDEETLVIQGDLVERVEQFLRDLGYKVK